MKSRFDPFSHRELIKKQHLDAGDTFWSQGLRTGWYEWMILYWQNINFKWTSMWANIQLKRIQMFLKALMMVFFLNCLNVVKTYLRWETTFPWALYNVLPWSDEYKLLPTFRAVADSQMWLIGEMYIYRHNVMQEQIILQPSCTVLW